MMVVKQPDWSVGYNIFNIIYVRLIYQRVNNNLFLFRIYLFFLFMNKGRALFNLGGCDSFTEII